MMISWVREDWQRRRDAHITRVRPWVEDHRHRAARGIRHPVYDFLFTYYSFRSGMLLRWSPGVDIVLEDATRDDLDWPDFSPCERGYWLPAGQFPKSRSAYLQWAIHYQSAILTREPNLACFGLHEWAMVDQSEEVRHSQIPLRLTMTEITEVVDTQGLRCTHYDAFRFFTPLATPKNRIALSRANTIDHDQPGCIHANMDLYKFAYKIAPFIASELLADCFELARAAREIDMRASPYDLRAMGFEPIPIETKSGRELYVQEQRTLAKRAKPLRMQILESYQLLWRAVNVSDRRRVAECNGRERSGDPFL